MKKAIDFIKSTPWFQSLLLFIGNVLFFITAALLLPVMFEDNDDTTMVWIANGIYSGTPDCHLVFINSIYGKFLAALYSWVSSIEWYCVLFALWQIISMTVIANFIRHKFNNPKVRYISYTLFYLFWLLIIVRFQFTTTAAITAFASVLLMYDRKFIGGGILFLIAFMVRYSAAGLVGLVFAPMLIGEFRLEIKKCYIPLCVILLLAAGVQYADSFAYRDSNWSSFMALSKQRGRINDNPNAWRGRQQLPKGLSETNYDLITAFAMDPMVVTADDVKDVADKLEHTSLRHKLKNAWNTCVTRYYIWFLAIGALVVIIFLKTKQYFRWTIISTYLIWFGLLCLIAFNASSKYRVFLTSLMPMLGALLLSLSKIKEHGRIFNYYAISILIFLAIYGFILPISKQVNKIHHSIDIITEQLTLYNKRGNNKIVPCGADLSVELLPPFSLYKSIDKESFINPYCMAGSPLTPEYMSYRDFLDNELLLFESKPYNADLRLKAIKENYNINAHVKVFAESEHYVLLKFVAD